MMAGGDMGHDVCDDVGDGDNGNNDAGNNADKGDGGDAGGEGGGGSWRTMRWRWQRQRGQRRWRWLHIAGVVERVTFQFKKMGAKEWERSHNSNRINTVLHFIIMGTVENCNSTIHTID